MLLAYPLQSLLAYPLQSHNAWHAKLSLQLFFYITLVYMLLASEDQHKQLQDSLDMKE